MRLESPSFFLPVLYPQPDTFLQKLANQIEKSLYLGGCQAHVIGGNRVCLRHVQIPCWELALKVALFVGSLGLIPLVLLAAKLCYRLSTTFYINPGAEEGQRS